MLDGDEEYSNMNILHIVKYYFSKSYREKYIKDKTMNLIGTGIVKWVVIDNNGRRSNERMLGVHFYENNMRERKYKVNGSDFDIKLYWPKTKEYITTELWVESGIKPDFFEDILLKKLQS